MIGRSSESLPKQPPTHAWEPEECSFQQEGCNANKVISAHMCKCTIVSSDRGYENKEDGAWLSAEKQCLRRVLKGLEDPSPQTTGS